MFKKVILIIGALVLALTVTGYVLYERNEAPAVALLPATTATFDKPFVIKMHAKWCPVCMLTKKVWTQIESQYAGRVNLVVFDFTDYNTTSASASEANRLGLDKFFEEYAGRTGTIAVLDGRSKEVTAAINGIRNFEEYQAAIDAATNATTDANVDAMRAARPR